MASYGTSHGERVCEACVFGRTTPPAKCCLRLLEATKLAWASHWAVRPYTVHYNNTSLVSSLVTTKLV